MLLACVIYIILISPEHTVSTYNLTFIIIGHINIYIYDEK